MSDIAHPRPSLIDQCLANIDELKELSESLENGEDKSTLLSSKARESISLLHHLLDHDTSPDQHALKHLATKITELELLLGKKRHTSAVADSLYQKLFQKTPELVKNLEEVEGKILYQRELSVAVAKANILVTDKGADRLSEKEYRCILDLIIKKNSGESLNDFEKSEYKKLNKEFRMKLIALKKGYDDFIKAYGDVEVLIDKWRLDFSEESQTLEQIKCIEAASHWKSLIDVQDRSFVSFELSSLFREVELLDELSSLSEVPEVKASILLKIAVDKIILLEPFLYYSEHPRLTKLEYEAIINLLRNKELGAVLNPVENIQLERLNPKTLEFITSMDKEYQNLYLSGRANYHFSFQELQAAILEKRASGAQIRYIIACKKWAINRVRTQEVLLDFKVLEVYKISTRFGYSRQFQNIAGLQSDEIDIAVLEDHLTMHQAHTTSTDSPMNVVVEGAGSVGLYSALKAFVSGANVTVVNDRSEQYSRNRALLVDEVWKEELKYFLGTKYKELFGEDEEIDSVSLRFLEDLLKVRMVELSTFIDEKSGGYLRLFYEMDMKGIVPTPDRTGYEIVTVASEKPSAMSHYEEEAIRGRLLAIMRNELRIKGPEARIQGGRTLYDIALERASAEYVLEKEAQRSASNQRIQGDLLICCGGAHDQIRSEYISPIISFTEPKLYQVGILLKTKGTSEEVNIPDIKELFSKATFLSEIRSKILGELKEVISTYNVIRELVTTNQAKATKDFKFRMVVTPGFSQFSIELPESMKIFLEHLKKESELVDPADRPLLEKYDDLKNEIIKWALYNSCPAGYTLDPSCISSAIFALEQTGGDDVATLLVGKERSMIITCAGDSLRSPHFYSASGLTTGRDAADLIASVIQDAHKGSLSGKDECLERLRQTLPLVSDSVLKQGKRFVTLKKSYDVDQEVYEATIRQIKKIYEETKGHSITEIGFRIGPLKKEGSLFSLEYLDLKEEVHKVLVKVSKCGILSVSGVSFGTIKTLILTLQNS